MADKNASVLAAAVDSISATLSSRVDHLYLVDKTAADAPSMKAVLEQCMSLLTLLNEDNLQVETLRREAFKPTTPRIYKSLITKPGESHTLLCGWQYGGPDVIIANEGETPKGLRARETKAQEDFLPKEASAIWKGCANHLQMSTPLQGNRLTRRRGGSPNDEGTFFTSVPSSSSPYSCLMVGGQCSGVILSYSPATNCCYILFGCQPWRVGRHSWGHTCRREVDWDWNASPYKCLGIACRLLNSPSFRCPSNKCTHSAYVGQHNCHYIYINKEGTHSLICNDIAKSIWQWATHRNIWLSAAYVPGSDNTVADFKSLHFEDNTEWLLSPVLFQKLTPQQFSTPRVDLLAGRLNHQVETFVSWKPEAEAWAVDAFSLNWKDIMFYAFPPFSVLGWVLSKIKTEQASGILVLPLWPTQPWFPVMMDLLMDLLMDHPRLVKPNPNNLLIKGNPMLLHPLHTKLSLLVTLLSGQPLETLAYRKALLNSSPMPGERVPQGNMTPLYGDGEHIVANGKLIPLLPLYQQL